MGKLQKPSEASGALLARAADVVRSAATTVKLLSEYMDYMHRERLIPSPAAGRALGSVGRRHEGGQARGAGAVRVARRNASRGARSAALGQSRRARRYAVGPRGALLRRQAVGRVVAVARLRG